MMVFLRLKRISRCNTKKMSRAFLEGAWQRGSTTKVDGQIALFDVWCGDQSDHKHLPCVAIWVTLLSYRSKLFRWAWHSLGTQNALVRRTTYSVKPAMVIVKTAMTMIIVNSQNKKTGLKQSSLIACTDPLQGKSFSVQKWQRGSRIH